MNQRYAAEGGISYDLSLYEEGDEYRLGLQGVDDGALFLSTESVPMTHQQMIELDMEEVLAESVELVQAPRNAAIQLRRPLDLVTAVLPDGPYCSNPA